MPWLKYINWLNYFANSNNEVAVSALQLKHKILNCYFSQIFRLLNILLRIGTDIYYPYKYRTKFSI
jgi:hypothetical protein